MPNKSKTYVCNICSRSFRRNEHLSRHIRTHTQERPFPCPFCVKHFARQDILKRHINSHSNSEASADKTAPALDIGRDHRDVEIDWLALVEDDSSQPAQGVAPSQNSPLPRRPAVTQGRKQENFSLSLQSINFSSSASKSMKPASRNSHPISYEEVTEMMKLPAEMYNNMMDDYARQWLRAVCKD